MNAVESYFEKLFAILTPLQSINGGPIIAFQVENEFGSYVDITKVKEGREYLTLLCKVIDGKGRWMVGGGEVDGGRRGGGWWEEGRWMVGGGEVDGGRRGSGWWEEGRWMVRGGEEGGGWWEGDHGERFDFCNVKFLSCAEKDVIVMTVGK